MTLNKTVFGMAAASFFGLLFLSEALLRLTVPTGFWYRHFDLSGDLTSLAEVRDRVRFAVPPGHRVFLLGDSVLGASALTEHRLPDPRSKTLSTLLNRRLRSNGSNGLSLGSDGLLLPDIEGLTAEFADHPPERILLLLNFRMFAKDFTQGPKALSRSFLRKNISPEFQGAFAVDPPAPQESRLSDDLYEGFCARWVLFRETQMFKTLWYYPSQKDFYQRILERAVGRSETQSDLVEAALRLKVASYYQPYSWDKLSPPFGCLGRTLERWAKSGVRVTVVLTPQNKDFLGDSLDGPSFDKNRKTLADFMKSFSGPALVYQDWSTRYPPSLFLDHCHLTSEGNERYAQELSNLLEEGGVK